MQYNKKSTKYQNLKKLSILLKKFYKIFPHYISVKYFENVLFSVKTDL